MAKAKPATIKQRVGTYVRRMVSTIAASRPNLFLPQPGEALVSNISVLVEVPVAGIPIKLMARNSVHLRRFRAIDRGTKEPETVRWILQTLHDNEVFVDVGANVGVYSVLAAIAAPGTQVFAFEPEPQSAAALAETVALNGLSITVFPIALSDRFEVGRFHIHGAIAAGLSDHQLGEAVSDKEGTFTPTLSIGMVGVPLDHLIQLGVVKVPTHIKIDVDGREIDVINGMREALQSGGVRYVAVEAIDLDKGAEIERLLQAFAFFVRDAFSTSTMRVFGR